MPRKLLYFFGFLGILLFVVPMFVDLSKYSEPYLAEAQKTIGRSLKTGSIHLQILPTPRIKINDVVVGNSQHSQNPNMLTVKNVEVILSLTKLLTGNVVIKSVNVNNPELYLEKFKNDEANWNLDIQKADKNKETQKTNNPSTANAAMAGFLVKQIDISDAVVHYTDHKNGTTKNFSNLNIESSTEHLLGPYKINISCESGFDTLELDILTGKLKLDGNTQIQANVSLSYEQQKVSSKIVGLLDIAHKKFNANFTANAAGLQKSIELPNKKIDLHKDINLKGEIAVDENQVHAKNLVISHPIGSLMGSVIFQFEEGNISTDITFSHQDDSVNVKCLSKDFEDFSYRVSSKNYQEILRWFTNSEFIKGNTDISGIFRFKNNLLTTKKTAIQLGDANAKADIQFDTGTKEIIAQGQLQDVKIWGKIFGHDLPFAGSASIGLVMKPDKDGTKVAAKIAVSSGILDFDGKLGTGELVTKGSLRLEHLALNEMLIDLKSNIQVKQNEINLGIQNVHLRSKTGFDLSAGGDILVDLSKEKIHVVGSITAQPVKLTAYNGEQLSLSNALYYPEEFKYKLLQVVNKNLRWSSEKINLPLSLLNMNLKVSIAKIMLSNMIFEGVQSEISLLNGKLSIPFSAHLYGGSLGGTLQAEEKNQAISFTAKFSDVAIEKIQAAAAHFKQGKLSGNIDLKTNGKSQSDFVARLNGNASFNVADGIVKGFDLHEVVGALKKPKNLLDLKVLQSGFSGKGETAFSKMSGSFVVKNGVATTNDLTVQANEATMKVEGEADILNWQMRFVGEILMPDVKDLPSLKFIIKGPIDSPSYNLDLKQLQQMFMKKGVGELVSKAIPGIGKIIPGLNKKAQKSDDKPQNADNSNQEPEKSDKPEKVVKNLIKGIFG